MILNIPLNFFRAIRKESSKTQILWMRWLAFGEELQNIDILGRLITESANLPQQEVVDIYEWGMLHLDDSPFFKINRGENMDNTELLDKIRNLESRVKNLEEEISKKKPKNENFEFLEQVKEVLDYLNDKTKSDFRVKTPKNRENISARLKEGWSVEDMKQVIDKKVAEWYGTEMQKYLRPMTLFNSSKFESYVNQKNSPVTSKSINNLSDAVSKAKEIYGIG